MRKPSPATLEKAYPSYAQALSNNKSERNVQHQKPNAASNGSLNLAPALPCKIEATIAELLDTKLNQLLDKIDAVMEQIISEKLEVMFENKLETIIDTKLALAYAKKTQEQSHHKTATPTAQPSTSDKAQGTRANVQQQASQNNASRTSTSGNKSQLTSVHIHPTAKHTPISHHHHA